MRPLRYVCVLVGMGLISGIQAQQEPWVHIQAIRHAPYKGIPGQPQTGDSAFLEYVIQHLLEDPADLRYISARDLLRQLCIVDCDTGTTHIRDTLPGGVRVEMILRTKAFVAAQHTFRWRSRDSLIEAIDGMPAIGAVTALPSRQADTLILRVAGQEIPVPTDAYRDLFDPVLCTGEYFTHEAAVFHSLDGRFIYLYLHGGTGPNLYLAKLVFDHGRYVTRIVAEYPDLLRYAVIRDIFMGF
ncbi:MAG: hypothetical protein SF053_06170 [Bacteroidia bacterium]|nr:hypothetical protein [Bacteroidia bacterium]